MYLRGIWKKNAMGLNPLQMCTIVIASWLGTLLDNLLVKDWIQLLFPYWYAAKFSNFLAFQYLLVFKLIFGATGATPRQNINVGYMPIYTRMLHARVKISVGSPGLCGSNRSDPDY